MKPYYHDERAGIEIYNCDCRDWLRENPARKFDLCLTDIPFGTGIITGGYGRAQNYGGIRRQISGDLDLSVASEVLPLCQTRILNGYIVSFCASRLMKESTMLLPAAEFVGEIIWDKGTPGLGYKIRYMHESALVWSIGNPEMPENALLSVIRVQVGHHNAHLRHPHEKPIAFWKNALNLPGQSIFDPFLGSGTSLVAAKNLGRHAVGIEIEERYAEISATRLQQEVLPLHAATPIVNQDAFLFTEGKE